MTRVLALTLLGSTLISGAAAQVSHTATTRGSTTLTAFGGGTAGSKTLPSGSDVSEGLWCQVQTGSGDCLTQLTVASSSAEIELSAWCGAFWPGAQSRVTPTDVLARFTTNAPTTARIVLEVEVLPFGAGTGAAGIDVDDDGVDEVVATSGIQRITLTRAFGATPVVARLHLVGSALDLDQVVCRAQVRVEGVPPRFFIQRITEQWPRCRLGRMDPYGDSRNRGFWLVHNMDTPPTIYALGVQAAAQPVVGACVLHVVPLLAIPAPRQLLVPVPAALTGNVLVQAWGTLGGTFTGSGMHLVSMR